MLPSFVIGLREGLEAALIVGIVAAFLRQHDRRDVMRWVWAGVAAAVVLCLAVGVGLHLVSENLPYRQQEGLETVIALVAVAMVTYMIVWMRRNGRALKAGLEGSVEIALATGSVWALVSMAFLAVVREGFETSVFLLAAFNQSRDPAIAGLGAVLGILVAVVLGALIYRGGLRVDIARFFRVTGVVLVLVAAGLVVSALHSAHEAGWIDSGQGRVADLSALVGPGSVRESLLTGILGLQARPVTIEVIGWVVYAVPMLTFVLWPTGRRVPTRALRAAFGAAIVVALGAALVVTLARPAAPDRDAVTFAAAEPPFALAVLDRSAGAERFVLTTSPGPTASGDPEAAIDLAGTRRTAGRLDGRSTVEVDVAATAPRWAPGARLALVEIAAVNGGRLPLGVTSATDPDGGEAATLTRVAGAITFDDRTGVVLAATLQLSTSTVVELSGGPMPLADAEITVLQSGDADQQEQLAVAGRADDVRKADTARNVALVLAVVAAFALATTVLWSRRHPPPRPATPTGASAPPTPTGVS